MNCRPAALPALLVVVSMKSAVGRRVLLGVPEGRCSMTVDSTLL
jgi:hypothetical protein